MKTYEINEQGKLEVVKQYRAQSKHEATDDIKAYSDDIAKLEERCHDTGSPEVEISQFQTKSGRPEFITLSREKHFNQIEDEEGCALRY